MTTSVAPRADAGTPGARLHMDYMDAARSILIMLGVVLHASNIYAEGGKWLVNDADSRFCAGLRDFVHLFRMPAFFIISGFFCAYTLPRYTPARFLRVRMTRLIVPFLAAALTLNWAQILISQHVTMEGVRPLANPLPGSFWLSPGWVYHLWFLLNLMIYFLVVVAVVSTPAALRWIGRLTAWLEPRLQANRITWLGLVMLPACATVALHALGWLVPALHHELLWFDSVLMLPYYAIFFVTGMLLGRFRVLLDLFMKPSIGLVALLPIAAVTFVLLDHEHGLVAKAAASFTRTVLVMLICQWVLLLFKLLANRPSRTFLYLGDASYSIYLFHHLFVVLAGIALLALPLPPVLKLLIVTTAAVAVSLAIHHFAVLRVPLLRFLFNGKYEAARPAKERASEPVNAGAPGTADGLARASG